MSSSKAGHCEQVVLNKPPVLMAGKITPEALQAWDMGCLQFFWQKEITKKDQVSKVTWNLQDIHVCDWYNHDCDCLNSLTFEDFMKEKMLALTQGDRPFHVWAIVVQSQNVLLQGDKSHLSNDSLCYHLESHMHIDLIADYHSANITAEKDLHKWIKKVRLLDKKHLHDAIKIEMAMRANHQPLQSSHLANVKLKDSKTVTDGKPCTCVPPLTNHTTPTFPNDFPDAKRYITLTTADVEVACSKKHTKPVATITEDEPALKCSCFMEGQPLKPVAVIMPLAALGSGSESADECIAPLTVPHFH
ncbi:hypothetical protein V8B97DRAFT_2021108 [Scleroderma yunnanense]